MKLWRLQHFNLFIDQSIAVQIPTRKINILVDEYHVIAALLK